MRFDAFGGAVEVEAVGAEEADEGDLIEVGEFDGEAGGGADAGDEGAADHDGFLHEIVADSAAED